VNIDADEDVRDEMMDPVRFNGRTMTERLLKAGKQAYGLYNIGDAILVEVVREENEYKGPVATAEPSLTGRFTVFKGTAPGLSAHASKKLSVVNRDELSDLGLHVLRANYAPIKSDQDGEFYGGGGHLIMRTASMNASVDMVHNEVKALSSQWRSMVMRTMRMIAKSQKDERPIIPRLVWRDSTDFKGMVLRELCSLNISSLVVPDHEALVKMNKSVSHLREGDDNLQTTVRLGSRQQMKKLISNHFEERVPIYDAPSAEIVIQSTEALTAIDVNTGSSKLSITKINILAARTAAAVIRRRNISGIIVIDFVNAPDPRTREQVYRQIEAEFAHAAARDRAKVSFTPISFIGLMEITREHLPYGPSSESSDDSAKKSKSSASNWLERRTR
jgi:Rne/Rng family ribonuclease